MNDCGGASITTRAEWLACLHAPGSDSPNQHDADELNIIYAHSGTDAGSGNGGNGGNGGGGGPPCSKKPNHPNCVPSGWVTVHTLAIPSFD